MRSHSCKSAVTALILIGLFQTLVPEAMAQDPIHKTGRGVVNVLTGWIEIPNQVQLGGQNSNPVTGVIMGFGNGVGLTVLRLGVGIYEAVTGFVPYPKGYVSPYEGMQLSDYAWE